MSKNRIVDADCHILEPPNIWKTWLPKQYQDQAPQLVKDAEGGDAWQHAGFPDPDPIGLVSTPGLPYDKFRWLGVTYDDARPGCYIGAERLKDMDLDGTDAAMMYAPQRTIGHFLGSEDDDFLMAGVEAYNNFLFDEFCAPDPTRLVGLWQIPSIGIDQAIDSVRKAKARGAKGVVISNWPSGGDSISAADDPFWAACVDEGIPVAIHINLISRRARIAERKAAQAAGGQSLYGSGKGEKLKAKAVGGMGSVFSVVPKNIASMIFTGTFERFPELHVNWVEVGAGWIPHFLETMDDKYWRNRSWADLELSQPPSYYWRNNNSCTFILDKSGIDLRERLGVHTMMWSSDYPHHGNDWPYSRRVIEEMMGNIPADERAAITGGNAARVFGLDD